MTIKRRCKNTKADPDTTYLCRIREKFREVFGSALTLPDEVVITRYCLTSDGDLVMILR